MDQQSQSQANPDELPPSLQRALSEPDEYAVRLRSGELIRFARAERQGSFLTLLATDSQEFPHGLEVRITEIAACTVGPYSGSISDKTAPLAREWSSVRSHSWVLRQLEWLLLSALNAELPLGVGALESYRVRATGLVIGRAADWTTAAANWVTGQPGATSPVTLA